MAKVTYGELVTRISDATGYTENSVNEVLKRYREEVKLSIKAGDDVVIPDFMSIKIVDKAARKGYDFKTGKNKTIPAHKAVVVTPGKALKESVGKKRPGRPKKK